MSMTQEEIEALMNDTADISVDSDVAEDDTNIDDILSGIDGIVDDGADTDIDDILSGIDGIVDDVPTAAQNDDDIDDLLAGIDGIVDDVAPAAVSAPTPEPVKVSTPDAQPESNDLSAKIDNGIYPFPVEKEHKIVNQLNEVADDSEEKASQIFDVLSFILDENDVVTKNTKNTVNFIDGQIELLNTLAAKFPNVAVFSENLEYANTAKKDLNSIETSVNDENNKIFEAMELMQFHDINRQKIERVMAVIKKLTQYLNGIFSDDSGKDEVQIAKHISGDANNTVEAEDLESLISEYSK